MILSLFLLAAAPSFQDVVAKFKPATLPLTSKDVPVPKAGLSAADVTALGLLKTSVAPLAPLRQWKASPEEGETHTLWPVATFKQGDVTVLFVRFDQDFPMGSTSGSFLLSYSAKGALIDGVLLASSSSTEAGGGEESGSIDATGAITTSSEVRIPMHDEGLPEELVITSSSTGKLTATGRFERTTSFTTNSGAFIDRKSKEELRVFGDKVFYRANDSKPFQALLREGDAVRFKKGGKPYGLAWDERRATITCTNPDGTKQLFTREW